jgi:hypothetical protein
MNINDIVLIDRYPEVLARFESSYIRTRQRKSCWVWTSTFYTPRGKEPRAVFHARFRQGRRYRAHASRFAWVFYRGPIPEGAQVLHRCDNPMCVNPNHLFLGTQLDNIRDMLAKGRNVKGTGVPQAKLTPEQVLAIRKDLRPHSVIARDYGMAQTVISRVIRGRNWRHLPGAVQRPPQVVRGEQHRLARLTADVVRYIRSVSVSDAVLAERYRVHDSTIRRARSGETWKHVR